MGIATLLKGGWPVLAGLIPLSLVGYFVWAVVYYRFLHPLAKFPGPFLASISNLWKVYECYTTDFPRRMCAVHEKYGPVVRVGPNDLIFNQPEAIPGIYKMGRKMPKSVFYNAFASIVPDVFSSRDESFHSMRVRQVGQSFSVSGLKVLEPMFDKHIGYLLDNLDKHAENGTAIDLKRAMSFYGYDVTGQMAFATDFQTQVRDNPEELPPLNDHFFLGILYACVADILPFVVKFTSWIPWVRSMQKSRQELITLAEQCISDAKAAHSDKGPPGTLLGALISAQDPKTGQTLTKEEITSESFVILVAGSHTTSSSLLVLFWHLLHNPDILKRVIDEIEAHVPKSSERIYQYTGNETDLKYTLACVRESFRATPIVSLMLPRLVTDPAGQKIDGQTIPQGTNCTMISSTIHHNPKVWGPDHEKFDPDHFVEGTAKYHPNNANILFHFGQGHRQCVGRNVAMMSIWKVLITLLMNYEFEVVEHEPKLIMRDTGVGDKVGPFNLRVKKRVTPAS